MIGTAVVALVFDVVLVLLGKVLMPWTRAGAGRAAKRPQKSRKVGEPAKRGRTSVHPGDDVDEKLEAAS